MSTTTVVTADELLALPTGMGKRYELVAGELRTMSPSGGSMAKLCTTLRRFSDILFGSTLWVAVLGLKQVFY